MREHAPALVVQLRQSHKIEAPRHAVKCRPFNRRWWGEVLNRLGMVRFMRPAGEGSGLEVPWIVAAEVVHARLGRVRSIGSEVVDPCIEHQHWIIPRPAWEGRA